MFKEEIAEGSISSPINIKTLSETALMINLDTGEVLYEKKADIKQIPGSITKMFSAFYVIDRYPEKLDHIYTTAADEIELHDKHNTDLLNNCKPYWIYNDAVTINLHIGEKMTLFSLLNGTLICSGCDAINVIAKNISGNIATFVKDLNAYVSQWGCLDTLFQNPHGLYYPDHYTTANDIALFARKALANDTFKHIVSSTVYNRPQTNMQRAKQIRTTNLLLHNDSPYFHPKAIGVKTGRTDRGGATLVAAAKDVENNIVLLVVLLKSPDHSSTYKDALLLFDKGFDYYKQANSKSN